jgi:ferric enterobactin receptor
VIDSLGEAVYDLKVDFIGYKNKILPGISLSSKKTVLNLGQIQLASSSKSLNEVTVTGQKSFLENHIDKLVFNVGNDITSQGGIATDVLKKVPQVSVDLNGNVELQGNSNVRVFINGKPSTMFDNNLADALAVIPASEIEKIEVITSPGAQYDAEGTAGIINILLKQHKEAGINGSANISVGTRLENGSVNINRHKGPLNINLSLGGNTQLTSSTLTNVNRNAMDSSGSQTMLAQNGDGLLSKYGYKEQI